jgi:hypothetical protein
MEPDGICVAADQLDRSRDNHDWPNPVVMAYVADYLVRAKGVEVCPCTGRYGSALRISVRTAGSALKSDRLIRRVVDDPSQAGGHGNIADGMIRFNRKPTEKQWKEKEKTVSTVIRRLTRSTVPL